MAGTSTGAHNSWPRACAAFGATRPAWASACRRARSTSYLQEWLPNVAQAAVSAQMVDSVGIGRLALSYPHLPADVLHGTPLQRRQLCRTFSDCTTAPRNGLVSGCYPLDEFYKARPEWQLLAKVKRG